ncbi:MAG: hypothetical protein HRT43_14980 [Campylobacteraceae bacterium]|nr:hypothetical protein [Campylobacteraceae bacterium]
MKNLLQFMFKYSTGKIVLGLFALTMIVYLTMILYTIPSLSAFAPAFPVFDLSPSGYSFSYANELLQALGSEGRNMYLYTQLPLDFIYPGLFSITYSLLLVWLFRKSFSDDSKIHYLFFVPLIAGVFDYFENLFIIKMINSFPELQAGTVQIASIFTVLKSGFTVVFFTLLLMGFILFLKKRFVNTPN